MDHSAAEGDGRVRGGACQEMAAVAMYSAKRSLRAELKQRLRALSAEERLRQSRLLTQKVREDCWELKLWDGWASVSAQAHLSGSPARAPGHARRGQGRALRSSGASEGVASWAGLFIQTELFCYCNQL